MTNRFTSHFIIISLIHGLILMGSWQLATSEVAQKTVKSYAVQLKMASKIIQAAISQPKAPPRSQKTMASSPTTTTQQVRPENQVVTEAAVSGLSEHVKADLRSLYHAELRGQIEKNKSYPPVSRRLGQTGLVIVAFTLLEDGNIIDVRIDSPSAYERLNDSALEAVKKVGQFKPIPKELGENKMDIRVPIKFFTI